jgi:hypothetical protein
MDGTHSNLMAGRPRLLPWQDLSVVSQPLLLLLKRNRKSDGIDRAAAAAERSMDAEAQNVRQTGTIRAGGRAKVSVPPLPPSVRPQSSSSHDGVSQWIDIK